MLFSATMRGEVVTLARTHMRHPVNIRAEAASEAETVPTTAQFVYQTHDLDKPEVLARLMQAEGRGLTMVFTRTKRQAQKVAEDLIDRGFPAAPLHGDMAQIARERAMRRFREGKVEILVATDVAARGIDVEGITHVVNYSCPEDEKTYVHRIGRTGRAGASGIAVTFVDWPDTTRWKVINNALGLPYEQPEEIYSTSERLYHDHGIPHDAQGRLARAARANEDAGPAARESRPPRTRGERTDARPKRNRSRRRTRGGQPTGDPAVEGAASSDARPAADGDTDEPARRRSRSRNRRRRSGARGGAGATPPPS
jgi:superfamily II DNA/RNA helicase